LDSYYLHFKKNKQNTGERAFNQIQCKNKNNKTKFKITFSLELIIDKVFFAFFSIFFLKINVFLRKFLK
jgi:hypothetical protein